MGPAKNACVTNFRQIRVYYMDHEDENNWNQTLGEGSTKGDEGCAAVMRSFRC